MVGPSVLNSGLPCFPRLARLFTMAAPRCVPWWAPLFSICGGPHVLHSAPFSTHPPPRTCVGYGLCLIFPLSFSCGVLACVTQTFERSTKIYTYTYIYIYIYIFLSPLMTANKRHISVSRLVQEELISANQLIPPQPSFRVNAAEEARRAPCQLWQRPELGRA